MALQKTNEQLKRQRTQNAMKVEASACTQCVIDLLQYLDKEQFSFPAWGSMLAMTVNLLAVNGYLFLMDGHDIQPIFFLSFLVQIV